MNDDDDDEEEEEDDDDEFWLQVQQPATLAKLAQGADVTFGSSEKNMFPDIALWV